MNHIAIASYVDMWKNTEHLDMSAIFNFIKPYVYLWIYSVQFNFVFWQMVNLAQYGSICRHMIHIVQYGSIC